MAFNRAAFSRANIEAATKATMSRDANDKNFSRFIDTSALGDRRLWFIKTGTHIIDLIPFLPEKDFGGLDAQYKAGKIAYALDVFTHREQGSGYQYACPQENFGKPCPVCEEFKKLRSQNDSKEWYDQIKHLRPQRRTLYNVWVHDPKTDEESKGVQILDISYFFMGKNIASISTDLLTGEIILFADPDSGRSIGFQKTVGANKMPSFDGFQSVARRAPLPDAILQQAIPLEKLVREHTYEELKTAFGLAEEVGGTKDQVAQTAAYGAGVPETVAGSTPPWEGVPAAPVSPAAPVAPAAPVQAAPVAPVVPSAYAATQAPVPPQAPTAPVPPTAPAAPAEQETSGAFVCPSAAVGGEYGKTCDSYTTCQGCPAWGNCAQLSNAYKATLGNTATTTNN